ncbi:sugar phosphate nucleotidyltransferase [Natronolimnohabitans sp. A-GB9]|uniref:sugar phosphate nucleotidyltransferase n=1 Tax=Natronolimnohabitans sp. A-GB9 TaxID=3069757 RepID=UPI0027B00EF4|nr:sugar phosphate nucleotidyltransferase [Natronolimnohabitans sp. A-GB9]MDQ2052614.1 sugar phosphate nucleotidyltransferase [Natronolimnohabitans sp. A-GB9]
MESVTAVVLAGGEGARLRPLTHNRPKPLLPAATTPILEHVFDRLLEAGVTELVVVVGYERNRVQAHFGPTYENVPITYVTQDRQLGSGHALLAAEEAVEGTTLVVNGDQIVSSTVIGDVLAAHDESAAATLGVLARSDVGSYGGVILEDDTVTEIVENPQDDRCYRLNAGVYAFEPAIFDAIRRAKPRAGEQSLTDGITALLESDADVHGVVSEGLWVDATYPWDLLDVSVELFDAGIVDPDRDGVADTATVHESAVVREPVAIAPDCEIGAGAVVGPYACLGENVTVGSNAVVERSVVDADTRIGASATVVDCVTGVGVTVGNGTTIPGGPGDVRVGDRVFEDESLGAVLGDRVEDQGGCTYVPGAVVGSSATVSTGATVRGTLAAGTEVRP